MMGDEIWYGKVHNSCNLHVNGTQSKSHNQVMYAGKMFIKCLNLIRIPPIQISTILICNSNGENTLKKLFKNFY